MLEGGSLVNVASWIILAIVIVWIGFAVRSAFFGGSRRRSRHADHDDDEKFRLPSACAGCSKGSCAGCSSANLNVPAPTIRELEAPAQTDDRRA